MRVRPRSNRRSVDFVKSQFIHSHSLIFTYKIFLTANHCYLYMYCTHSNNFTSNLYYNSSILRRSCVSSGEPTQFKLTHIIKSHIIITQSILSLISSSIFTSLEHYPHSILRRSRVVSGEPTQFNTFTHM